MKNKNNLTPRQERFVAEYFLDMNATKAALRAGYSQATAREIASENLQKPAIKAAIEKGLKKTVDNLGITKEYIINSLVEVIEMNKDNPKGHTNLISAAATLNKMLGYNEVKRVDITTGGERINWIEERTYTALPPNNINEVK